MEGTGITIVKGGSVKGNVNVKIHGSAPKVPCGVNIVGMSGNAVVGEMNFEMHDSVGPEVHVRADANQRDKDVAAELAAFQQQLTRKKQDSASGKITIMKGGTIGGDINVEILGAKKTPVQNPKPTKGDVAEESKTASTTSRKGTEPDKDGPKVEGEPKEPCLICFERERNTTLSCGHVFCLTCLHAQHKPKTPLLCSQCRKPAQSAIFLYKDS